MEKAREKIVYAGVYKTDGYVWVDTSTIHVLPEETQKIREIFVKKFPDWARDNKFLRIGKFKMVEVTPE